MRCTKRNLYSITSSATLKQDWRDRDKYLSLEVHKGGRNADWVLAHRDGRWRKGGLLRRPAPAPSPGSGANAYVCSFEVADLDVAADLIAKQGGSVALPKFAVPSM